MAPVKRSPMICYYSKLCKLSVFLFAIVGLCMCALICVNEYFRFMVLETASHYVCKVRSPHMVVVGDSIGAGGRHWAGRLELLPLSTKNLAGDGYTFHQLPGQISKALAYKPKFIIVFAGTNDAFAIHSGRLSFDELKVDVQNIIVLCKGVKCIFVLPPPSKSPEINYILVQVRETIKSVADQNGVALIDPVDALSDDDGIILGKFTTDGVHLSSQGYVVISSKIKNNL